MDNNNPILQAYLKGVKAARPVFNKELPPQRVMRSFKGSPCTQENKCACGHFKRYHLADDNTETGACIYCACSVWRQRTPEQDKKKGNKRYRL